MPMMIGSLYPESGPPIDLADKIAESTPKLIVKLIHQRIIHKLAELDKDILDGIRKTGFQTTSGEDGSGFIMRALYYHPTSTSLLTIPMLTSVALNRAGGYYFDTGACAKVASGDIRSLHSEGLQLSSRTGRPQSHTSSY